MQELNNNGIANNKNNSQEYESYSLPVISQSSVDEDDDNLSLTQLVGVVKQRFRLFVIATVGITAAVTLWSFTEPAKYKSKFQLLIEPPQEEESANQSMMLFGMPIVDYETEMEVLKSPKVLNPIIQNIGKKYPKLSGLKYEDLVKQNNPPLMIEQLGKTKVLEISYEAEDPFKVKFILDSIAQGYLDYSLDKRKTEVKQGMSFVDDQLPKLKDRVNVLHKQLENLRQKYQFLVPETYATELSQQLVNLQTQFLDAQIQLNEYQSLSKILAQQLGLNPEQALAASYLSESPRYQNLLNELQKVEVQIALESTRFLENAPTMQSLKEKQENLLPLLSAEAEIALGDFLGDKVINSPNLASPSTVRLTLSQDYIKTTNEIKILNLRVNALNTAIQNLQKQIGETPIIARQYADLELQLTVATQSLERFLLVRDNLDLESAQKALYWQIIFPAKIPEYPFFPKKTLFILLGIVCGTLFGFSAVFLDENFDPVIHSYSTLKNKFKLPILGIIPLQKEENKLEQLFKGGFKELQIGSHKVTLSDNNLNSYHNAPFLEAFRSLNTNIRLLGSETRVNSIVISSSTPGEGKSTVSLNLAKAAAAMGQKVLLVDADLRLPQAHTRLELPNHQGLSNVIVNDVDLETAIQEVPQWENLYVLTAGDIPPDPTRLLSSRRMGQIIEYLKNQSTFNLVIYDTPPVLGFADSKILAAATNGIVLVSRIDKTDRNALKHTIDELRLSKISILGLVANGVNGKQDASSYYHKNYYRYYKQQQKVAAKD